MVSTTMRYCAVSVPARTAHKAGGLLWFFWSALLFGCLVGGAAVADGVATGAQGAPPPPEARFGYFDAGVRANREAMLRGRSAGGISTLGGGPPAVGIGTVTTQGGGASSIVNQTEIHGSTIVIQNN